jgi:phage terminase small subunit
MRNQDGLTNKEFLFCEEYLKCGNARQSYRVAFPTDTGNNAWYVLKRPHVIAYINKRYKQRQSKLDILLDLSMEKMRHILEYGTSEEVLEATKNLMDYEIKKEQILSRLKDIDEKNNHPPAASNISISIVEAKPNE